MPPAITACSIISLLDEHQILDTDEQIHAGSDLFALGLDSLATMQLLLQLERAFGISLPPAMIRRDSFATPASVAALVNQASVL